MGLGGIERVISVQLGMFLELGWAVLLVLDRPLPERHFPIPDGVRVFIRTPCHDELVDILRSEKVDVYYDQGYLELLSGENRVEEWKSIKDRVGCKIYLHWHTFAARILAGAGGEDFYRSLEDYRKVCDGVLVLSRVDRAFFAALGFRAFYVPNPVDPALDRCATPVATAQGEGRNLVWCGRLTASKRPEDAIRVFARVAERCPGCRLTMVGGGDVREERRLRDLAESLKVSAHVDFAGADPDVYARYRRADVYLQTSKFEGFSMTLLEAMAFGLPVVCYDMPYLELLRDNPCAASVRQGDVVALADAVTALLSDETRRKDAGKASRTCYERFRSVDLADIYAGIFVGDGMKTPQADESESLLLDEILQTHFAKVSQARIGALLDLSWAAGRGRFGRFLALSRLCLLVGKVFGRPRRRETYGRRLAKLGDIRDFCFERDGRWQ